MAQLFRYAIRPRQICFLLQYRLSISGLFEFVLMFRPLELNATLGQPADKLIDGRIKLAFQQIELLMHYSQAVNLCHPESYISTNLIDASGCDLIAVANLPNLRIAAR